MGTVNKYTLDNVESPNSEKRSVQGRIESSTVCVYNSAAVQSIFRIASLQTGREKRKEKCWAK
jgi:hypothetical protein